MAVIKFNIYYSTSKLGPWTLANNEPIEYDAEGNEFTLNGLDQGTNYYVTIVGGIEVDDEFIPLVSQPIGPNLLGAGGIGTVDIPTILLKGPTVRSVGDTSLGYLFSVPADEIERIQSAINTSAGVGVTSFDVSFSDIPLDHSFLVMAVGRQTSGVIVSSITQTGATWVKAIESEAPINGTGIEIWYAKDISNAGITATINYSTFAIGAAVLAEFSGIDRADPLDKTASNFDDLGTTTGSTGTTDTTTQAEELWIGALSGIANPEIGIPTNNFETIPFRNLLSKDSRDMENAPLGWNPGLNTVLSADVGTVFQGTTSLKIDLTSVNDIAFSDNFPVTGGETYTASIYLNAPIGGFVFLTLLDSDGRSSDISDFTLLSAGIWTRLSVTHIMDDLATEGLIRLSAFIGGPFTVYADAAQVILGTDPGTWLGGNTGIDPVTSSILETLLIFKTVDAVGTANSTMSLSGSTVFAGAMATFKRRIVG